jgi:carbonic anhydrase
MDGESQRPARRAFLGVAAMSLGAGMAGIAGGEAAQAAEPSGGPTPSASTPGAGLNLLKEGNARFVEGKPVCGPMTAQRVKQLKAGQSPFAIVVGCSDSRVPIETIFDQAPGRLFVVRVAGNFITDDGLGSIEYAIAVLKSSLLLVLGHSSCGAVHATVDFVENGKPQPGHIQNLVQAIEPAAKKAKSESGDWLANAIAENVKMNVNGAASRSEIVADAVRQGKLQVVGGVYDLGSGRVNFQ